MQRVILAVGFEFSPSVADQKQDLETQWEEEGVGSNQRPWPIDADRRSVRLGSIAAPLAIFSQGHLSRWALLCSAIGLRRDRGRPRSTSSLSLEPECTASESRHDRAMQGQRFERAGSFPRSESSVAYISHSQRQETTQTVGGRRFDERAALEMLKREIRGRSDIRHVALRSLAGAIDARLLPWLVAPPGPQCSHLWSSAGAKLDPWTRMSTEHSVI